MTRLFNGLAVLVVSASAAMAQDVDVGAGLYDQHCAVCHGADAMGNGPLAPALQLQPSNLVELTARHDGAFPLLRVINRIDGTDPLVSHGSPMPIYGPFFEGVQGVALKADSGQPVMVSQPVADLVEYLRSIQP
ncbi:MAG: cytochrome c [Roseobacter sp.]